MTERLLPNVKAASIPLLLIFMGWRGLAMGAELLDADSVWRMYCAANHKQHSVFEAEMAIRLMRAQFPDSPHLPVMEFGLGHRLLLAHIRYDFVPEGSGGGPSAALERLKRFLPGEPYGQSKQAGQATVLYAKGLLMEKRPAEAKTALLGVVQSGRPRVEIAALKALVYLREPLGIGDDELSSIENDLVRRRQERGRADPEGDELLASLQAAGDPSLGAVHLFESARLHRETADDLRRIKDYSTANAHQRQVLAAGSAFMKEQGAEPPPAEEALERWVKIRYWVGHAEYALDNWQGCLEATASIVKYTDHPVVRIARPAVEARLYWNQCRALLGVAPVNDIDADLLALLAGGKCRAQEIGWIFQKLASHARERGDTALEYLYLRDLRDRLYQFQDTFNVARKVGQLEQNYPNLKDTPENVRSPADGVLAAANLIAQGMPGLKEASGRKHQAQPDESRPKYYKTFVVLKEDADESLTP